ncbi:hypothetical protein NL676_007151 [Syzygium grande]|nr:hypothetical protein NL676_007151 [Syzygium grande]
MAWITELRHICGLIEIFAFSPCFDAPSKIGEDNMLWMHKLLKRLSRTIDQEEPRYTVRHSRLYMDDTDLTVINRKEGLEEVEALCFDFKNCPLHMEQLKVLNLTVALTY